MSSVNDSVLHILMLRSVNDYSIAKRKSPTVNHVLRDSLWVFLCPRPMPPPSTSSLRRSCDWLSQKALSGRSCHYVFRRLVVNRPPAIMFFADLPPGNLMTLTLTNPGREFSSRFPVFDANIPFSRPVTLSRPTTSR